MSDYLQYGGQAVIEGVMMRSPRYFAVACRKPDGSIVVQEEPISKSSVGRLGWLNRPFLRGTLALIDAMALGMKALAFAAYVQADALDAGAGSAAGAADGPDASASGPTKPVRATSRVNDIAIGATMVFAVIFGVALFVALPTLLTQLVQRQLGLGGPAVLSYRHQVGMNFVDGVIRITIFLGYIALISRMQNIRRVFQYHGAEHKAINTLEAGRPLTLAESLQSSRIHPRCGTSFIIVVLLVSILVHCLFMRPPNPLLRVALHISLIPLVAGIAYEVIKLAGRHRGSLATRILLAPGLWSQRLTTREPEAGQVEVALSALGAVLRLEGAAAVPDVVPAARAVGPAAVA